MDKRVSDNLDENLTAVIETQIYRSMRNRFNLMRMPVELESLFEEYDLPERINRFLFLGIIGLVLYNFFMIGDRLMLPDIYREAWAIRALVVTPVCLIALLFLKTGFIRKRADLAATINIVLISASIMVMLLLSNHPNVAHYHTGILIVIAYGNIIMRPRLSYAMINSVAICVLYGFTAFHVDLMNRDVSLNSCFVLFGNAFLTLAGNFYLRVEKRRDFLYTMLREIDAEKLEASNRILSRLSIIDELTGLANRRHFDDQFEKSWRRCMRNGASLSLIFIDIDFFKAYNDHYGHQKGDWCLAGIAKTLSKAAKRPGDLVARYGGEEFVILLDETSLENSLKIAEKVRDSVSKMRIEHQYSNVAPHVTLSLGVASLVPDEDFKRSELVLYADKALYQAKERGRNQVCTFSAPKSEISAVG